MKRVLIITKGEKVERFYNHNFPDTPLSEIRDEMRAKGYRCLLQEVK